MKILPRRGAPLAAPSVTELAAACPFWAAADEHQAYFAHNLQQPYCVALIHPSSTNCAAIVPKGCVSAARRLCPGVRRTPGNPGLA